MCAPAARGYSVLTHQAIIDTLWEPSIRHLLLKRFPHSTAEELKTAHAHVYGGCIIQDMGYYPFGSRFFSDLTHYVRSGDFILALIRESRDLNEYAFALGALAHYAADNNGHRIATNRAVPLLYPKLRRKFGDVVTFDDNPAAHLKTEFGFDVLQVARGRYAPEGYRSFIGFEVSKPVLERAFLSTYGIEISDVFTSVDLALGTYRHTVGSLIPQMTRVAWDLKKDALMQDRPRLNREQFVYELSTQNYRKEWGAEYQKPGIGAKVLALLFRLIPRIGPLKALTFRAPTPQVETLFLESFDATVQQYRELLSRAASGRLRLANENFDTGKPTRAGSYERADRTYAKLVDKLSGRDPKTIPDAVRSDVLAFYSDLKAPISTKEHPREWAKLLAQLHRFGAVTARAR